MRQPLPTRWATANVLVFFDLARSRSSLTHPAGRGVGARLRRSRGADEPLPYLGLANPIALGDLPQAFLDSTVLEAAFHLAELSRGSRRMWALDNRTPFAAERGWARDREGAEVWIVVVKATFLVERDGGLRVPASQVA